MESERRGRGKKPSKSLTPGTFRPASPADSQGVVHLFAIAARAACAQPKNLLAITENLSLACASLMSPELDAAQECARMWQLFAKVAQLPKDTLRLEAGRAFCRDLDALAQRLELPPLAEWIDLPEAISEEGHQDAQESSEGSGHDGAEDTNAVLTLEQAKAQAHKLVGDSAGQKHLPQAAAAALLAKLEADARSHWLERQVGQGTLARSDVNLLIRFLAKGGVVQAQDTTLIEVLDKLVRALA